VILLWGLMADAPTAEVRRALTRLGHPPWFLDQRATVAARVELRVGSQLTATVDAGDGPVALGGVTAAYLRPYDPRDLPAVQRSGAGSPLFERAVRSLELLLSWGDLADALIVNRPSMMASNCSKPFQSLELRAFGFSVPDTLITTDPEAVLEFRARHRHVVYKSISGVRSVVTELTDSHLARLGDVCWCPTQFQQRIPGADYRVHVVGGQVFATEILSEAVDYRYAGRQQCTATIRATTLDDEMARRCVDVSRAMGLPLSGVDLRRTPDGEWYCFEVNPSPGFTYFQAATGQPIGEAVARLLIEGAARAPGTDHWAGPRPKLAPTP
jgi:hypothetical protein